jgi:transposase, IS6 family
VGSRSTTSTIYRWVQRFAPEFAETARARQHLVGDRWHVDETYLKVGGTWRYLFRAIDQFGQVIDVLLSPRRTTEAARRFFAHAISRTRVSPTEVTTDRYRVYPGVLGELLPAAFHDTKAHANNPLETDHGRLKARLRPMRGLKRDRTARVIVAGHAFVQNLRRGFYDLGTDVRPGARLADAFRRTGPRDLTPEQTDRSHRARALANATVPVDPNGDDIRAPRAPVERSPPGGFCGLLSDELINIEDVRQEEVPDDHERDQTEGYDHTSESVTGPDCRPHNHRSGQADRKPDCRILYVAKHEVTLAPGTALIQPRPGSPRVLHGS